MLTGQVSYRMTYNQSSYIRVRFGIYHFVRRVPADVKQHYLSDRVSISEQGFGQQVLSKAVCAYCRVGLRDAESTGAVVDARRR